MVGSGPRSAHASASAHRWPWGLVAGAGTVGVMLVGIGLLAFGMRDRVTPRRAAAPLDIAGLASGPLTSFDSSGLFSGPPLGNREARDVAPSVVRIEGAGTGSGVIVRGDGIVLTSAQLVGSLPDVNVTLEDGTSQTATIRGTDPVTGLAVVDLPGEGFTPAGLVSPDGLAPGGTVLCAGVNDDGFTTAPGTLTKPLTHTTTPEGDPVDGVLQITPQTTTYPTMLGSAVVDGSGSMLALTTWTDSLSYYATPMKVAAKVADDLLATGSARHAWVGILGTDAPGGGGVQLTEVDPDGPAAGSLQVADVITELDGKRVADMSTLVSRLQLKSPGDRVDVTYQRDGLTAETELVLTSLSPE